MTVLAVVFADGSRLVVPDPCVLGRAPDRAGSAPVAVPDPDRVVSKNHITMRALGNLCELTDLGSTNGTAVSVGGDWVRLEPGVATHATVPCRVDCGGVIVGIEPAQPGGANT